MPPKRRLENETFVSQTYKDVFSMKKLLNLGRSLLAVGLAAAIMTTPVYGAEDYDDPVQEQQTSSGGYYIHDMETEETRFVPYSELKTYSNETEGSVPGTVRVDEEINPNPVSPRWGFQTDNRYFVTNEKDNGFRATVCLEAPTANGGKMLGTGFLIYPNIVVTASHNICNKELFGGTGWVKDIVVTPAKHPYKPNSYGSTTSIALIAGGDANIDNLVTDNDWGIIILKDKIGSQTGWFGLRWQSAPYDNTNVTVYGYSYMNEIATPYVVSGTITKSNPKTLESTNIFTDSGMSGGPCYIVKDGLAYVIGITSYFYYIGEKPTATNHVNSLFCRIDETLYNILLAADETYGSMDI